MIRTSDSLLAAYAVAEREKYEKTWANPEYRRACHGLALWHNRRELFPAIRGLALDIGCGTGRLIKAWLDEGIDAWGIDIALNAIDDAIRPQVEPRVKVEPVWDMSWSVRFDFAVCADVAEHWPTPLVGRCLRRIAASCDKVLFKIAHVPDVCGGGSLHLTVKPLRWWLAQMEEAEPGSLAVSVGVQMRSGFADSIVLWSVR